MSTVASGNIALSGPVVAAQSLTKVFRDFWMRTRARAVDDVTFHIDQGEIFGLLGPNGSGKSTTIKVLLGLLRPTRGRVAVFGKPPSDVSIKKRIGYLPEESFLYEFLNARETLDYYGKLFELDARTRRARIDELLEMVGLTAAQHRPVRDYSKGMRRRIGLAQALINDPDLLILDEPTTGLDPIGTRQVKDLIIELGRRGKTVLLSSHLLADVEDVADRMVILFGGKIRREGTCDDLLASRERSVIELPSLDDETIAEIDALVRRRTGGEQAVLAVSRPRQKLEQLFVSIVDEARRDRLETSGADNDGMTAAFLRAEEETVEGDELIGKLVEEGQEPKPAPTVVPPPQVEGAGEQAGPGGEGDELIRTLVDPEAEPEFDRPEDTPSAPIETPKDIDVDLISGLTGSDDDDEPEPGRA